MSNIETTQEQQQDAEHFFYEVFNEMPCRIRSIKGSIKVKLGGGDDEIQHKSK